MRLPPRMIIIHRFFPKIDCSPMGPRNWISILPKICVSNDFHFCHYQAMHNCCSCFQNRSNEMMRVSLKTAIAQNTKVVPSTLEGTGPGHKSFSDPLCCMNQSFLGDSGLIDFSLITWLTYEIGSPDTFHFFSHGQCSYWSMILKFSFFPIVFPFFLSFVSHVIFVTIVKEIPQRIPFHLHWHHYVLDLFVNFWVILVLIM